MENNIFYIIMKKIKFYYVFFFLMERKSHDSKTIIKYKKIGHRKL